MAPQRQQPTNADEIRTIDEAYVTASVEAHQPSQEDVNKSSDEEPVSFHPFNLYIKTPLSPPSAGTRGHYVFRTGDYLHKRYGVIEQLGQGVSAKVMRCYDTSMRAFVAIKVFRESYIRHGTEELHLLLNHTRQNGSGVFVVQIKGWFLHNKHLCIVSEMLGPNLDHLLGEKVLHDKLHIVHADLKPQNVVFAMSRTITDEYLEQGMHGLMKLLSNPRSLKVIDFGSAMFNDKDWVYAHDVGTRAYRALDVILAAWSFPCDIWSVGCMLVEFYAGENMFQSCTDDFELFAMMERVLGQVPRYLIDELDYIDEEAGKEFKSCLKNPSDVISKERMEEIAQLPRLEDLVMRGAGSSEAVFLNLLQGLLSYDPCDRLTAREALGHPFFNSLHD